MTLTAAKNGAMPTISLPTLLIVLFVPKQELGLSLSSLGLSLPIWITWPSLAWKCCYVPPAPR
jgi:hypothetical protein